ncbi:MAG TPA: hypothetical protein VGA03_06565 [Anaerolineales bacterium]
MSDQYYREQAARRARKLWLAGGAVAVVACVALGIVSLYYDSCTGGFDRSPEAVLRSFASSVSEGEAEAAQACWEREAYFDLEAGCSELCLQTVLGNGFEIVAVEIGQPNPAEGERARLPAQLSVACREGGETYSAEIVLDTAGRGYPWRHWHIVRSTLGGTVAEPWCR